MGDVMSLIEKAQEAVNEEDMKVLEKRIRENSFTLEDYLSQFDMIKKMGSMSDIMSMLPGMNKIKGFKAEDIDEKRIERIKAIILSMTKKERRDPNLLNYSRKQRIASGSGTTIQEINQLLKQYEQTKVLMKQFKNGKKRLPFM